jgi:hypothetical protein
MPANLITFAHFSVSSTMGFPKPAGGTGKDCVSTGEVHLNLRIGESRIDLFVELVDNFPGRVFGRADSVPTAHLETGAGRSHRPPSTEMLGHYSRSFQ